MLRSIATVSISGTLPEKLHAIAAAGYQGGGKFSRTICSIIRGRRRKSASLPPI